MDMDKFNSKKFVKERKWHEEATKTLCDLFPESLHRLYVINAPSPFRVAWKVIQTFLDPVTAEKTKILGKDFIADLIKDINLDMIPHKFGGIGPWDIRYGDTPVGYELSTSDLDFDYASLPPNELPMPPRAAPPDMNKHKARREKAMKAKGLEDLENLDWDDDEEVDDEKEADQSVETSKSKEESHKKSVSEPSAVEIKDEK